MIIGVGIDVAEIERFGAALERTPQLADRLFVESELTLPSGERRGIASLAARFAAKEALAKALGAPGGLLWSDAEVWVEAGKSTLANTLLGRDEMEVRAARDVDGKGRHTT
ncbi:4'-phosphopantetheinyl transferase superfamily protein, partial [Streptomyces cyaneofuscatus]|uniref:4'-phosphopantetheinyl transferase superfamily protein n=1 Tax=Streptomyces cyaneofuscatus TaxID=66883 RepID=UPI0033E7E597